MGCFGSKDKKPKGGAQGNAGTNTKPNTTNKNPPATQLQERKTTETTSTQPNKNRSILAMYSSIIWICNRLEF